MYYRELREKIKNLNQRLCLNKEDKEIFENMINFIDTMENLIKFDKIKGYDVTNEYKNMINAFESDFNLAFYYNDITIFDDLKRLIENENPRLNKDIELLQDLSFGIRYGLIKIYKKYGDK